MYIKCECGADCKYHGAGAPLWQLKRATCTTVKGITRCILAESICPSRRRSQRMEITIDVVKRENVLLRIWHSIAPALAFFKFIFSLSEIPATYKYDVTVTIREQKK
jgi:hypothetical protein